MNSVLSWRLPCVRRSVNRFKFQIGGIFHFPICKETIKWGFLKMDMTRRAYNDNKQIHTYRDTYIHRHQILKWKTYYLVCVVYKNVQRVFFHIKSLPLCVSRRIIVAMYFVFTYQLLVGPPYCNLIKFYCNIIL